MIFRGFATEAAGGFDTKKPHKEGVHKIVLPLPTKVIQYIRDPCVSDVLSISSRDSRDQHLCNQVDIYLSPR